MCSIGEKRMKKRLTLIILTAVVFLALAVVIGYFIGWVRSLELLIVPVVLAIISLWLRWVQNRDEKQEEVLKGYLDRMAGLIKGGDSQLLGEREVARAWTLETLQWLDGKHKGMLLRFLVEWNLIERGEHIPDAPHLRLPKRKAVVFLNKADLSSADLEGALLIEVDLIEANLEGANLRGARLTQAVLFDTNLRKADLRNASLRGADLRGTNLTGADLHGADLTLCYRDSRTNFTKAKLKGARGLDAQPISPG
jgi:hypothetical protein